MSLATTYSTNPTEAKDYAKGAQKGTFTSYEQRAAECGGEALYGMDKELAQKAAAKWDPALEAAARQWVQTVVGISFDADSSLQAELKSGVVLCQLANTIKPGVCKKPSTMSAPFKQMENIANYLLACEALGVPKHDQFQTVALFENKDMMQVLTNLQALGRTAPRAGYSGPTFGAKLADANVREFAPEVLAAGAATQTFMGKGSTGHASQAGMFDTSKEIVKSNAVASSVPTMMAMGSTGHASQAGMVDTRRNIVKAC